MNIDIGKIIDLIKDPDLKLKINDLYGENIQLKEVNHKLKQEIEKYKEIDEIKSKLVHEDNHYFVKEDDSKDGPYCTNCWDSDYKLIRLHKGNFSRGVQYFTCPKCKTQTEVGTYIHPERNPGPYQY